MYVIKQRKAHVWSTKITETLQDLMRNVNFPFPHSRSCEVFITKSTRMYNR